MLWAGERNESLFRPSFSQVMAVFYRFVISAVLFFATLSVTAQAPAAGTLEGHLKIVSPATVELADGSLPTVTPQTYPEYPLAVLSSDGKQQIATVTADAHGNFRATLPPGSYLLDIENRARKHVRAKPVPFTIAANQISRADMEMDTGVR
jgi:hypothetical protein